jgi:asparagine synthase (glutamine-hydrolysing)
MIGGDRVLRTDRFGLKNIYLSHNAVSDDIGSLVVKRGFPDYSAQGISSYFTFRYPVLTLTMFDGIERLDTGMALSEKGQQAYWRPRFSYRDDTEAEAIRTVTELLSESIRKVVGDRRTIGIALSGGLDSSLIAAMCRRIFPRRTINTYSCGFYGDDEFEYSRIVARLFSNSHKEIVLGKNDFVGASSIMASLIRAKCAPLHPNEIALAHAEMQARTDQCDIVLCGEGADDIFGGYSHNLRMFSAYSGPEADFFPFFIGNYRYFSEAERERFLAPHFNYPIEAECDVLKEDTAPIAAEDKALYITQRLHTRGLIERGYNAMRYCGFEPGFPFIDEDLVDYVNGLDFDLKIRSKSGVNREAILGLTYSEVSDRFDTAKFLLKKVAESYLPEQIIYRQKKGFPVPFDIWFSDLLHWDLDDTVFRTNDLTGISGWKKFMLVNLDTFVKSFNAFRAVSGD